MRACRSVVSARPQDKKGLPRQMLGGRGDVAQDCPGSMTVFVGVHVEGIVAAHVEEGGTGRFVHRWSSESLDGVGRSRVEREGK
mmetsp:Transcript_4917/g.9803  ORF Transcript_4917/g.9803 Transcript_4917/m.9803 type:complete len:84 (-) Transcript_4917:2073-2324(-)